ncbi:MAG: acyl-CoA ligase (AMP-forming), exosortase A system-associated [Gammaproteobacteria bacterium]|nr:acyl-CoA ligase (AMP-forming), exosortase A system-associated [Gammaproteobacteria bacterium]
MSELLHQIVNASAQNFPNAVALKHKTVSLTYTELDSTIHSIASGFLSLNLQRSERIAVYLPKQPEAVISYFAASMAGAVFVPINPVLKSEQVCHILADSNARILVTSSDRLKTLESEIHNCHDLQTIILVGNNEFSQTGGQTFFNIEKWETLLSTTPNDLVPDIIDIDMVAILYTSGSTGKPKGVILSYRNMVTGAKSVSHYLKNDENDRILAVLPFSFDYGFSQLTTAFYVGATVVLMEYLLPRDVIKKIAKENITGLAAVPPLWIQLSKLEWPDDAINSLRYITNSGGAFPTNCISFYRSTMPSTDIYLMYGLTEAFRSTYLPPEEIDKRPDSMGKAIPNVEILVVRDDGTLCSPGETGELVHRGSLVAMGYWNDPEKTANRFKPLPNQANELPITEMAVWSGDNVKMDNEGYLYFVSRMDEMIKTSGYRVSPTEVEEVIYQAGMVNEAVALGVSHQELGQAIVLIVSSKNNEPIDKELLQQYCKQHLPNFMLPYEIIEESILPRNPNGKIDRKSLHNRYKNIFQESS